ncbi:MAG: DMT family transporter, partial [Clostridia bacterium]|nr:DMT family transporter [Clostridia bacterium]
MTFILGVLAGFVMPAQTSINTRLRKALQSPFRASCVNFLVGLTFIVLISFVLGDGLIPLSAFREVPVWMLLAGLCGVMVLTCNLLLFPVLGSVQTVIFPVFGQITAGV